MRVTTPIIATLIGLSGLLLGCSSKGPKLVPVSGQVVFEDSVAMQGGTIEFTSIAATPEEGISSRGTIGPDGKFQLTTIQEGDGAVAGEHRAIVIVNFGAGLIEHNHDAKTLRQPDKKFAKYSTSGLKFTVKAGETNHLRVEVQQAK